MNPALFFGLALPVTLLLIAQLAVPIFWFMTRGWTARRDEMMGAFSTEAIDLFFNKFYPAISEAISEAAGYPPDPKAAKMEGRKQFEDYYDQRFRRRPYFWPIVVFVLLAAVAMFFCVGTALASVPDDHNIGVPLPYAPGVAAAIAGAYTWVFYDLISRAHRRDLMPAHLSWMSFRFVVSVFLALTVVRLVNQEAVLQIPLSFLIGTFPNESTIQLLNRLTSKYFAATQTVEARKDELVNLQGINSGIAQRFAEEGITSINLLAMCNPVEVTMQTGFPLGFVLDSASQAFAWLYLEDDLAVARLHGFRGALEILGIIREIDYPEANESDPEASRARIQAFAQDLKNKDAARVENIFRIIEADPYTVFMASIYSMTDIG